MCRFLALAGLLLSSAMSAAQGVAYYPLGEGDRWTYEHFLRGPNNASLSFQGYRTVIAGADTTVGGETYRSMDVRWLRFTQETDSTARCLARVRPDTGSPEWISLRGVCGALEHEIPFGTASPSVDTYYIGRVRFTGTRRGAGSGSSSGVAVEGVGVVEARRTSSGPGGWPTQKLLAATIGGTTLVAMPEPTAWRTFQPLGVGDRWLYRIVRIRFASTSFDSYQALGTTMVGDREYVTIRRSQYDESGDLTGTSTLLWRSSDEAGCVVTRATDGSESCVLGGQVARHRTQIRTRSLTLADGESWTTPSIQGGYTYAPFPYDYWYLAEGIGFVSRDSNSGGSGGGNPVSTRLVYARVGAVEVGTTPAWMAWAVSGEPPVSPPALTIRLAGPNPTRGEVRLRIDGPAGRPVTVRTTDVLGRTVDQRVLVPGPGGSAVTLDLRRHAAGVYVIRLTSPDGQAVLAVTKN